MEMGRVPESKPSRVYQTSLDRAGLALAVGAVLGGGLTVLLVLLGDVPSAFAMIVSFIIGTAITAMAITAIAGPIWVVCHALGKRGPGAAFFVGALAGFALFLGGQTYGFGLYDMPATDGWTLLFRWMSGISTSLILAAIAGLMGLAMWRVAYRRLV